MICCFFRELFSLAPSVQSVLVPSARYMLSVVDEDEATFLVQNLFQCQCPVSCSFSWRLLLGHLPVLWRVEQLAHIKAFFFFLPASWIPDASSFTTYVLTFGFVFRYLEFFISVFCSHTLNVYYLKIIKSPVWIAWNFSQLLSFPFFFFF